MPDGTWRLLVAPTVPIPCELRRRTWEWRSQQIKRAARVYRSSGIFLEPTGYPTTPDDVRRAGSPT